MNFKYYHGTSSIFLNSIRTHGLGKINPTIDFKNLEVLQYLTDLAERSLAESEDYMKVRDSTLAMAGQYDLEIKDSYGNSEIFNYRHDGIYVALKIEKAVIYAILSKSGSEILDRCINLYKLLKQSNISFEIPSNINLFKIEQYIDVQTRPILVEIESIEDESLEKEDGKTAKEALDFLRYEIPNMSAKRQYEFLQHCNFKILEPIPPEYLKFYEIDFEGHPAYPDFEFTLSRI